MRIFKTQKIVCFIFVLQMLLLGCATIFSKNSQTIKLESRPEGVKIYLDGVYKGETPLQVNIPRDVFKTIKIRAEKEGYNNREQILAKTLNKIALLNLTSWLSWGTDALTGAMIEYSPDNYYLEMHSSSKEMSTQEKNERLARHFLLSNLENVISDISRGKGEYIAILCQILAIPKTHRDDFIVRIRLNLGELIHTESSLEIIKIINREASYSI